MPNKNHIINLPGFILIKTTGFSPITYHVEYRKQPKQCIYCKANKLRIKDKILRKVRHESVGERCTFLSFFINKYHCVNCNKYFHQPIAGIQPYQRASEKLKAQIFTQHTHGISNKDLASSFKIGKATVERYYRQHYDRYHQQIKHRHCPSVLGIDEHFFSKKQGYATTLCDLRKHKVFDIVKGKTKQTLASYFEQLTGKDKVRVVCMDLSSSYKSIVKQFFPQAKIVADRFHVIRLLHYRCMKTYQQISANIKHNRPIMSLLRTNPNHLSAKQIIKLNDLLEQYPAINAIYQFQQKMHRLLMKKHRSKKQCAKLARIFLGAIAQLKQQAFNHLKTLGETFYQWRNEIACMWRFTKNNGITEGFHRKMKLIQRRAYGFRNFENYRLRVKVLCA